MTIDDLKNYYENGNRFEIATGLTHMNYNRWIRMGYIPILSQIKIEKRTNGLLKASLEHLPKDY